MFTGIIENIGIVLNVETHGSNKTFTLRSAIANELKVDQSLAHNGICLTVESIENDTYRVTAIEETLQKTNAAAWVDGNRINLERCMQMNGRLDGHLVQGHVDGTAICVARNEKDGSTEFTFQFDEKFSHLIVEKGSITVNGISLTCYNVGKNSFSVAIIPYTIEHTNIGDVYISCIVNLEFDIIGKYVQRSATLQSQSK